MADGSTAPPGGPEEQQGASEEGGRVGVAGAASLSNTLAQQQAMLALLAALRSNPALLGTGIEGQQAGGGGQGFMMGGLQVPDENGLPQPADADRKSVV